MTVEITSAFIRNGFVNITALDVRNENLSYMERYRDDGEEQEILFVIDTHRKWDCDQFRYWIKAQKATKECSTYGEALHAIVGTVTDIPRRYRSWE